MVPFKGTVEEVSVPNGLKVSFEWSHHRISSKNLKARTTLYAPIIDSGSNWNGLAIKIGPHCVHMP